MTTKNEALATRSMTEGLVRTALSLDTYMEALRDAHLNPDLNPGARAEIQEAARHLADARHKLMRAAKKIT